jgi:hypothetical protein
MTRSRSFEDLLGAWLDEGPEVAPRQLFETVLSTAPTRRQQRRGFGAARRFTMFGAPVRAAAIVAVLITGLIGLALLGVGDRTHVGPVVPSSPPQLSSPTVSSATLPSPSITASASPFANAEMLAAGGRLRDGATYTIPGFTPPFTIVGQVGWNAEVAESSSTVITADGGGRDGGSIQILRPGTIREPGALPGSQGDPVPSDLAAWLEGRSDLTLRPPAAITIDGITGIRLIGSVKREAWDKDHQFITIACEDGAPKCSAARSGLIVISEPGSTNELIVLNVHGQQLLIGLTSGTDMWPIVRPRLEAFLMSLKFEGATGS